MKAPCCGEFFTCHNCHDETNLTTNACGVEMKGASADNMGRYRVAKGEVKRISLYILYVHTHTHTQHTHTTHTHPYMYVCSVKCKECKLEQGVSNICQGCGIQFAQYFCQECKLYSTPTVYIYNIYKPFPPVNLPCTTLVTIQSHYVLSKKKLYYYNIVIFFF